MDTELVKNALKPVNDSYCLAVFGLSKHHVMYGHEIIRVILAKLFSVYLMHCYIPLSFSSVVFMPLMKDKTKRADDVNNYIKAHNNCSNFK